MGEILECTRNCSKVLGYFKKELIGSKLEKLMPDIYKLNHIQYYRKFVKSSDGIILNNQRRVFVSFKDNTIAPFHLYIKFNPYIEKKFIFFELYIYYL